MAIINNDDFAFYILADGTLMCAAANLKSNNVKFDNDINFGGYRLGKVIDAINNLPDDNDKIYSITFSLFGLLSTKNELIAESVRIDLYEITNEDEDGLGSILAGIAKEVSLNDPNAGASQNLSQGSETTSIDFYTDSLHCIALRFYSGNRTIVGMDLFVENNSQGKDCTFWVKDGQGTFCMSKKDFYPNPPSLHLDFDEPVTLGGDYVDLVLYFGGMSSNDWTKLSLLRKITIYYK